MILQLHCENAWNILSWSWPTFIQPNPMREAEVMARTCLTINHRWSQHSPPLGSQTPEIGESLLLLTPSVNTSAKPSLNSKWYHRIEFPIIQKLPQAGTRLHIVAGTIWSETLYLDADAKSLNITFLADSKKLDLSLECWMWVAACGGWDREKIKCEFQNLILEQAGCIKIKRSFH